MRSLVVLVSSLFKSREHVSYNEREHDLCQREALKNQAANVSRENSFRR